MPSNSNNLKLLPLGYSSPTMAIFTFGHLDFISSIHQNLVDKSIKK